MAFGFYIILAAQFLSALADSALLFVTMDLFAHIHAPDWYIQIAESAFAAAYVVLAPFVGAFADSLPKGRVMFLSNNLKIIGCVAMLFGLDPLVAYAIVGIGAATYSPAKYGILTEYLPPEKLVTANSWMEGLTVAALILGNVLGAVLTSPHALGRLVAHVHVPLLNTLPGLALAILAVVYVGAAIFALYIPRVAVDHKPLRKNPLFLIKEFSHCFRLLWKDPLGQVSLSVTTMFWGIGRTMRLLVPAWAVLALGYSTSQSAYLVALVAVGIAIGAVLAARFVKLEHAVKVLPVGILMGVLILVLIPMKSVWAAGLIVVLTGVVGGYFVVPMNALLQHRGHLLMGAGSSISVQNFNENLSIFVMMLLYAAMDWMHLHIFVIVAVFGIMLSGAMGLLARVHGHDQDMGQA
ncbi:MAG TPA: lysophospholipid transporter LplT [Gallionellaceae bacterium]|nr:lysophospholipid transporter LplT [Gallionellaceae bacterium]